MPNEMLATAAVDAAARKAYADKRAFVAQHLGADHEEVGPEWDGLDVIQQNGVREAVLPHVWAALEAVEALHALSTTFVIARLDTRHFEFEGVGADEHEARLAVRVAWERHMKPTGALYDFERDLDDDVQVRTYTIGKSYRDGSEI